MIHLRRQSPSLSEGSLELIAPRARSSRVLAYIRKHEREVAAVHLNFSRRAVSLDLREMTGMKLHSNLHDEVAMASPSYTLEPWEAIVLIHEQSRPVELRADLKKLPLKCYLVKQKYECPCRMLFSRL